MKRTDLQKLRLDNGLSIKGAARVMGVSPHVIRKAEEGQEAGSDISPRSKKRIADYYGMKVTDLWPIPMEEVEA